MSALAFKLPASLEAPEPPPERGGVRLLVAHRPDGPIEHARFTDLPKLLSPGDLLVVNVSATIPAAVAGMQGGWLRRSDPLLESGAGARSAMAASRAPQR